MIAEIRSGRLLGRRQDKALAFLGIPYAAPPVGAFRYRSPQPLSPWSGVREAIAPGAAPIQTLAGAAAWLYESAEPQSEDCLYLNVWTPAPSGRRPVMVWLHGGAWRSGHGAVAATNGAALAVGGDVVVVTCNYRLGVLGWLAHPGLTDERTGSFANWGLQDQIAALRWVRDNIAAFGGDPANVTIFGQSAGGASVVSIAQHPANAGLFHKLIVQSGSLHGEPAFALPDTALRYAEALAQRAGADVAGLRALPARQLHSLELELGRQPGMARRLGRPPVLPVLDGRVLTVWPRDSTLPAVPLLIGTTATEGSFWLDLIAPDGTLVPGVTPPADEPALQAMIADLVAVYRPEAGGVAVDTIAAAYREAGSTDRRALSIALYTDIVFRLRALEAARRHAAAGHATYLYEYAHPLAAPARGVPHTAEIPFVFGTFSHPFFAAKFGVGPAEAQLSAMLLGAWARFAHDGVPGAAASGSWVPVTVDGLGVNILGAPDALYRAVDRVRPGELAAWGC